MHFTAYRLDVASLAQGESDDQEYDVGDVVEYDQDAVGEVTEVYTEPFTLQDGTEIDASESSPVYEVLLEDGSRGLFKASDLDEVPEERYVQPNTSAED